MSFKTSTAAAAADKAPFFWPVLINAISFETSNMEDYGIF